MIKKEDVLLLSNEETVTGRAVQGIALEAQRKLWKVILGVIGFNNPERQRYQFFDFRTSDIEAIQKILKEGESK